MKATTKSALLMGFGAFGVLLGGITVILWPGIFTSSLRRMMVLTNSSMSYGIWKDLPIPMYLECHLFNITNVEELLANKSAKIKVEELGPYVYREVHKKVNIVFNDNNTVTYQMERFWHFEPEMSNGSLSDLITSINPIVPTIAHIVRYQRAAIRLAADVFMRLYHEHMFITANASSWLFDGIDDPILKTAHKIPDFPIYIPYDRFGWFYERNGSQTYDGTFVMNTGAGDFSQLGNVEKWRYSTRSVYRGECGAVKGSAGELWAPERGQPELTIFVPDLCTWIKLSEDKPMSLLNIEGMQFAANKSIFDNGWNYPHTACYCDEVRDRDCLPPGALNMSACRFNSPAFVSLPHFYLSDPYYPSKIEGLHPKEDHNFKLALEMLTGIPLQVSAQLQINFLVRHIPAINLNNQLPDPDMLVPMFWFRQELALTEEFAQSARLALRVNRIVPIVLYVVTAIGGLLLLVGITILVNKLFKSPDTEPILSESSEESNQ
ncbi:protein croquemort-like [Hyposmocoma kahamanoa]|uniref:protein croquemort-like n=1 Tax=Hyposmocoma kahamanoa TaxID=1477025 RepID=UPI000E6D9D0B|nr:protein croquemort-like [Hyposmocoma kahamanoa]